MESPKEGGFRVPLLTYLFLFVGILGIVPTKYIPLYLAKQLAAEWALILFFIFIFIKNNWAKAFLLWCLFITIHFYNKQSFLEFYTIILYAFYYQLIIDRIKKDYIEAILDGLCIITLCNTFWMGLQFFKIDPLFIPTNWGVKNPLVGFLLNSDICASYMAIGIPAFFRKKWLWALPIVCVALALTKVLSGILPLCVGIIFFILIKVKIKKIKFAMITLILIVLLFYIRKYEWSVFFSGSGRFLVWYTVLTEFIALKPFVGWGLGGFKIAYPVISKIALKHGSTFHQVHNEPLQLTCEIGIIGLLIVIGYLTYLFVKFSKNINRVSLILSTMLIVAVVNINTMFSLHSVVGILIITILALLEKQLIKEEKDVDTLCRT